MAPRGRSGLLPLLLLLLAAAAIAQQSRCLALLLSQPDPALFAAQLAIDADLRGEASSPLWLRALGLAPRSAFIGVNAALSLERAGQPAAAELLLLDTERLNRLWLPRWTLASFYLRNNRPAESARWARLALERSYADVRPALFDLLQQAGVPASEWLSWCRRRPELLSTALEYFGATGRTAELAAATAILSRLDPGRAPLFWRDSLHAACVRLVLAGDGPAAASAWNALVARRMIPFAVIDAGNRIGNPHFSDPIDGLAFNWRYSALPGVSRTFDPGNGSVRITFDGGQPESAELLSTSVWLDPARSHRFSCKYRIEGLEAAQAGPIWAIENESSPPLASPTADPAVGWRTLSLNLPRSAADRISRLSLTLNRRRGFTRAAGAIEISEPRLEVLR